MSRFDFYQDDMPIGPYKIIRLLEAGLRTRDTYYEVAWRCCGTHTQVSHHKLTKSVCSGTVRCIVCTAQARSAPGYVPGVLRQESQPKAPRGANDGAGNWWPMLGRMGRLNGYGNHN
jgi:hypothetical protein